MMEYDFIRKLMKNISNADVKVIYQTLTEKGIELFVQNEDKYINMTEDSAFESVDLYVSAADLEQARDLIMDIGLEQYLCTDAESNVSGAKSEVQKAEEEFYRKHKQNQIFALVIVVGVMVFMAIQFFVK